MHFAHLFEAHFIFSPPWIKLHLLPILLLLQSHVASFIDDYIVSKTPVRFPLQLPLSSQFLPISHLQHPPSPITLSKTRLLFLFPRLHLHSQFSKYLVSKPAFPLSPITPVSPTSLTTVFLFLRLHSQYTHLLKMGSSFWNSGIMLNWRQLRDSRFLVCKDSRTSSYITGHSSHHTFQHAMSPDRKASLTKPLFLPAISPLALCAPRKGCTSAKTEPGI